jgi:DNA polymerase IV
VDRGRYGQSSRVDRQSEALHYNDVNEPTTPIWDGKAVLHVDLDAFFAAVEQLDHPEWRGKPVIVGGDPDRRGVVSTASYEARAYGVRSAMPSVRAKALCPNAIWAPPRFHRYKELAEQVRAIFADETPRMQPVSIDEAYLDVTPGRFVAEDPVEIAERIRRRIARLGITGSVGVAATKTVAKIASDFDKPDGLTVVRPGEEAAFLAPLPIRTMPGIGPRSAERLTELGIRTLGDLAQLDDETAKQVLGSHGPGLVQRARGRDARDVHEGAPVKSVSNERTFAQDLRTPSEVYGVVEALLAKVCRRLRDKGIAGRTLTIKIRFSDFTTRTAQRTLPQPSDDEHELLPLARELVGSVWNPGVGVRLLGVGLSGFNERAEQLTLGEAAADGGTSNRGRDLVRSIDAVRERFGDEAVRFGRELRSRRPQSQTSDDESHRSE